MPCKFYRNSLEVVKKAASEWKTKDVEFIAQLGDIIDARAKNHKGSDQECAKVFNIQHSKVGTSDYL